MNAAQGTWIDWQYLFDAAKLLAKCRSGTGNNVDKIMTKTNMDKVSNMLPNSWQNVSWESDNYVEGPTQDTMFNLLIFSQIHPAVHISLCLLHRTLPQEGAGMLVFCLTFEGLCTYHNVHISVWVSASTARGWDRKFELEGKYLCIFISVFCIFVFYICVFVFGSIWCLKYFQYVILGGTCRDNRQRRLGKSVSYWFLSYRGLS